MAKNLNIGNSSSPVHVNINEKLMIKSNVVPAISGSAMTMGSTTVPTYVSDGLIVEASDKFAFWKDISDSTTGVSIDDYLLRTGGTMIGPLALSADPTAAMQATTKNYVDSNFLKLSGGTLTGLLSTQNVNPSADNIYSLGTSSYRYGNIFSVSGTISGNLSIGGSANVSGGIISNHGHNLLAAGNEFNFVPEGFSGELYINYLPFNRSSTANIVVYRFQNGNKNYAEGKFSKLYGAVWNDYAEYRLADSIEPGRCVIEKGDDTLSLSMERLQPGASIISDTFGFAIGETDKCKTPIAVSGRVLAYPFEDREEFKKNIGRPVCSGPNGTVSIMTDEEYKEKGYCAIGTISAVPDYEEWGTGNVKIDGRVWIKVR